MKYLQTATPGITVKNLFSECDVTGDIPPHHGNLGASEQYSFVRADWIEASVSTRLRKEQAYYETESLVVLFDGYLTDVLADSDLGALDYDLPAKSILALYLKYGAKTARLLRGSFVFLIAEELIHSHN